MEETPDLVVGSVCDREEWSCIGVLEVTLQDAELPCSSRDGTDGQGKGRDCSLVKMKDEGLGVSGLCESWVCLGCDLSVVVWVRPLKGKG